MTHFLRKTEALLLRLLHHRNRLSVRTRRWLREARQEDGRKLLDNLDTIWAEITGDWRLSVIFILTVIALPQVLISLRLCKLPGFQLFLPHSNTSSDFSIGDVLHSTWQVLGGLIGITFTIVVFLIEFAHTNGYREKIFSVFAERSKIILLVIFSLLSLLSIGVNVYLLDNPIFDQAVIANITEYNLFIAVMNLLAIIYLYIETFQLVQPRFWQDAVREELKKNVALSVERELQRRVSSHILQDYCEVNGIDLSFLSYRQHNDLVPVKANVPSGQLLEVKDINLSLIRQANERSKRLSSGLGIQMVIRPRQTISSSYPNLAFLPSQANVPAVVDLIRHAMKLSERETSRKSAVLEEAGLGRDLLTEAIEAGKSSTVETTLRYYSEALRHFLETLNRYNLHYTPELAEKENSLLGGWSFIAEMQKQFADLIEPALKSADKEIINKFLWFPHQIMRIAYDHTDFLLFRHFIGFFVHIYSFNRSLSLNSSIKEFIYDRCWRTPKEFYLYTLRPDVEGHSFDETQLRKLGNYVEALILYFNNLIKRALDFRDEDRFTEFASAVRTIPSDDFSLELRRSGLRRDSMQREEVKRLYQARHTLFLGLGGFLTHLLKTKKITEAELEVYLRPVHEELKDLRVLYETYAQTQISDIDLKYNWDSWEMNEQPETYGEVQTAWLKNKNWIRSCFVYLAIRASESSIPSNEQSKHIAEVFKDAVKDAELHPILQYLKGQIGEKRFSQRVDLVGDIFNRVAEEQRIIEENKLVAQPLDEDILSEFRKKVLENWQSWGGVRILARFSGSYAPRAETTPPEGLLAVGIVNQLEPKGAFVEQSKVLYLNWGEIHGRDMARGEDKYLIEAISSILKPMQPSINNLEPTLRSIIEALRAEGLEPLILYSGLPIYKAVRSSPAFTPDWRSQDPLPDLPGFIGFYDQALAIQTVGLEENEVIVVDIGQFAQLVQYRPDDSEQFPISISIETITPDKASEILNQQPEFHLDKETKERLDEEEAQHRLRQKVLVTILERIQFEQIDPGAGALIQFQIPDEPDTV